MAKLQIKSEIIATYGGIFQIMDVFLSVWGSVNSLIRASVGETQVGIPSSTAKWLKHSSATIFAEVIVLKTSTCLLLSSRFAQALACRTPTLLVVC